MSRRTNPTPFWGASVEQLRKLPTRQLLAILDGTRSRMVCSCAWGGGTHCGDDVLSKEDLEFNEKQFELNVNLKTVLAEREHIPRRGRLRLRPEKKVMRY